MDTTAQNAMDEHAEFVMSFVASSQELRDEFEDIWSEVEANYLVRSLRETGLNGLTNFPLLKADDYTGRPGYAILKDPETHQIVMTILSKIVLTALSEEGFVKALPIGTEDVLSGRTANKLIEYALRQPGTFWTEVMWLLNAGVYGTGIKEGFWDYREEPRLLRSISQDPVTGAYSDVSETVIVPVYDDPRFKIVDIRDFFPDTGATTIDQMVGCAKRFSITADVALDRAARGIYDMAAVKRAIVRARTSAKDKRTGVGRSYEDSRSGTEMLVSSPRYMPILGYEFYGSVPTKTADNDAGFSEPDGVYRRVITVFGGETVRNKPWPRRLPFFDCKIIPRMNGFYGLGVGEIVRYDQDFADTLKMMLADAVVRSVHAQPLVNRNAQVDVAKFRRFKPDVPIMSNDMDAVRYIEYNPPLQHGFGMYAGVKNQMREASGALGSIQGLGLGINRASATEASQTFQQALDRPELYAQVYEREWLPPVGKYIMELYREFLAPGTDDIAKRIGESEYSVDVDGINFDFDVKFQGSRLSNDKTERLNAYREAFALGANPIAAQVVPWIPLIQEFFKDGLGLSELAALVGNPGVTLVNLLLQRTQGGGEVGGGSLNPMSGNGNGTSPALAPNEMMMEQTLGSEVPL